MTSGFFAEEIRLPAKSERAIDKREGFRKLEKVYGLRSGRRESCLVLRA